MVGWLKQAKFDIWKLSPQSCISFFSVFFWQETYYSPKENICSMDSLKPPRHPFFSDLQPPPPPPSFSTFGIEDPPPPPSGQNKGGTDTVYTEKSISYFGQKLTFFFKFNTFWSLKLFFRYFSLSANLV